MELSLRKANALQEEINQLVDNGFEALDDSVDAMLVDNWQATTAALQVLHEVQVNDKLDLINARYMIRSLINKANALNEVSTILNHVANNDSQIHLLKVELRNIDIQRDSAIYDRKIELKKQELEKTERSSFSRDSVSVPVFTKAYKKDLEKQVRTLEKMNTRLKDKLLEKNITTKVTLPDSVIDLLAKYDLLDE